MTSTLSFQCTAETVGENKLDETYVGDVDTPSYTAPLLPSSFSSTDRDGTTGVLTESALNARLESLNRLGIVPDHTQLTARIYTNKVTALLTNAKAEYCFYYSRYTSSLTYLMNGIKDATTATNSQQLQQAIQIRLNITKTLNRKINDLIQIMNRITAKMMTSHTTLQAEIADFNKNLKIQRDKLEEQNKIIQSNEGSMRLQKEMVKYSEQKGRYSDNLLKLYSFLNIVTLGLLVYVYKAAGEE